MVLLLETQLKHVLFSNILILDPQVEKPLKFGYRGLEMLPLGIVDPILVVVTGDAGH